MQMGLIETAKQRPLIIIAIVSIFGVVLFSSMLSIYEEGKDVSLRPVNGSEVQGLTQTIVIEVSVENIHTVIVSGDQKPYLSITGINTSYQWNQTPSISYGGSVQKILYTAEHLFPGFGFYELNARVYYLYNQNVSDVRMIDETSTFEIVEKVEIPISPVTPEGTETTPVVASPQEILENPIVGLISKSLGVIVLIAGVVIIYFFYLRKRYKLP